jgi:hypothetical protein
VFLSAPVVFADSDPEKADMFKHCSKRAKVDTKVSARELGFDLRWGRCFGVEVLMF